MSNNWMLTEFQIRLWNKMYFWVQPEIQVIIIVSIYEKNYIFMVSFYLKFKADFKIKTWHPISVVRSSYREVVFHRGHLHGRLLSFKDVIVHIWRIFRLVLYISRVTYKCQKSNYTHFCLFRSSSIEVNFLRGCSMEVVFSNKF